jgi:Fe-S-cluster containining protein
MGEKFYADGLFFSCHGCSSCCRGAPGFVFLSVSDVKRLLARLSIDFPAFFRKYCITVDTGMGIAISLAEKTGKEADSQDCVFWDESGCAVYEGRPIQCSTYPFWASIMNDRASWLGEGAECSGIGSGEWRDKSYIEEKLYERRAAGTILLAYGLDPETADEDTILGC